MIEISRIGRGRKMNKEKKERAEKNSIPAKMFEEWEKTCEIARQVKTGLRKIVRCADGKYYAVKNR